MDLRDFRTLIAIAQTGSFESAARALDITASAISQRIGRLEDELGMMLVIRGTPAALTREGQILLRVGRQIDVLLDESLTELENAGSAELIPVAVNHDTLATWFVDAFLAFQSTTGRTLEAILDDQSRTTQHLRSGVVAVAISSDPMAVSGCETSLLGIMRYVAVVHVDMLPVIGQMPAIYSDRADTPSATARALNMIPGENRTSYLPGLQETRQAVLAKAGWAMMPYCIVEGDLADGQLVPACSQPFIDIPMYMHRWRTTSGTITKLCAIIREASGRVLMKPEKL